MNLDDTLRLRLEQRSEEGNLRSLKIISDAVDFSSNDYLGLARSESLRKIIHEQSAAVQNGSTGSRLLTGNSTVTEDLENELARIFHAEAALVFNSGYTANQSVLSAVATRGDTIIYDEFSHASIKDGARLSIANRLSFFHNDLADLERKMERSTGSVFVVVESIYSMDGDEAPLDALASLCNRKGAHLVVDEAHSTGCFGSKGNGLVCAAGLEHQVPVRIYTFGKAMGVHGACVAGSSTVIQYLLNFARPFIYTTAPSPHSAVAIRASFDFLGQQIELQETLRQRINFFRNACGHLASLQPGSSAIQSVIIPGNDRVKKVASELLSQGLDVRPILSPTVPKGSERLRIILHTYNTNSEIERLAHHLQVLSSRP